MSGGISIVLAHGQRLVRDLLAAGLNTVGDIEVVGTAATEREALAAAGRNTPAVVILAVGLPGADPVRTTCAVRARSSQSRVLVLADNEDQAVLTSNLRCGANGFITMDCTLADLAAAIRRVHEGEMHLPQMMLGPLISTLMKNSAEQREARGRLNELTRRERETLALLIQGCDTARIAARLVITPETARTHVQNVLAKLSVHSRLEASAYVVERGLVDELPEVPEVTGRALASHYRGRR